MTTANLVYDGAWCHSATVLHHTLRHKCCYTFRSLEARLQSMPRLDELKFVYHGPHRRSQVILLVENPKEEQENTVEVVLSSNLIVILQITDPDLVELIRRKVRLNQPYAGIFLKKNDE